MRTGVGLLGAGSLGFTAGICCDGRGTTGLGPVGLVPAGGGIDGDDVRDGGAIAGDDVRAAVLAGRGGALGGFVRGFAIGCGGEPLASGARSTRLDSWTIVGGVSLVEHAMPTSLSSAMSRSSSSGGSTEGRGVLGVATRRRGASPPRPPGGFGSATSADCIPACWSSRCRYRRYTFAGDPLSPSTIARSFSTACAWRRLAHDFEIPSSTPASRRFLPS